MGNTTPQYQQEYREKNPDYAERNRLMNKIRDRAKQHIVDEHREEYEAVLARMKKEAGL